MLTFCYDLGCSDDLVVGDKPLVVNTMGTSMAGVAAVVEANCVCRATHPLKMQENPQKGDSSSCLNGGTCQETWGDFE